MLDSAGRENEMIVPFECAPELIPPLTHIRSTVLVSSLQVLRARNLFDIYRRHVPAQFLQEIEGAIAGVWISVRVAEAHYQACDALGLSANEVCNIGFEVGQRLYSTLLVTLLRLAAGAGATPWTALRASNRIYERLFKGSGMQVLRIGAREARVDYVQTSLARYHSFRNAVRGNVRASLGLFRVTPKVIEIPSARTDTSMALRVGWI